MATLIVRNLPDALHRSLRAAAARHRRSMNQEAIVRLTESLTGEPQVTPPAALDWETFSAALADLRARPVADARSPDEILGYDQDGLPR